MTATGERYIYMTGTPCWTLEISCVIKRAAPFGVCSRTTGENPKLVQERNFTLEVFS